MDYKTIRQRDIESLRSKVPSIKSLLDFLQSRFKMLENIKFSSSKQINAEGGREFIRTSYGAQEGVIKSSSLVAFGELQCYFCMQCHTIYWCPSFTKLSVAERIKHISELKYCKNCLKSHLGKKCKGKRCSKCGRAHNVLLHSPLVDKTVKINELAPLNLVTKPTEQVNSNFSIPPTSTNVHTYDCNINDHVLLSTAIVYAYNYLYKSILCRVLLDSGSQNNFITEAMAHKLQLKWEKIDCSVYGINDSDNFVSHVVTTKIKSRVSDYEVHLNFLILPKLTSQI